MLASVLQEVLAQKVAHTSVDAAELDELRDDVDIALNEQQPFSELDAVRPPNPQPQVGVTAL